MVVAGRMVFGVIIYQIGCTWTPIDKEVSLMRMVLYPIKVHVHGFGSSLSDAGVNNTSGGIVISADGGGRLRPSHFFEGYTDRACVLTVDEEATEFGFRRRRDYVLECSAFYMDGSVVSRFWRWSCRIWWFVTKKVVT